jgi:UTP--glucose-1-phosphate uridylyltransferase
MNPKRKTDNLKINLDSVYFGKIDQFESRFKAGIPSLVDCESLDIKGDVIFEKNVRIVGKVKIENKSNKQAVIEEGKVIDSDIIY